MIFSLKYILWDSTIVYPLISFQKLQILMIIILVSDDPAVYLTRSVSYSLTLQVESKPLFLLRIHGVEESRCMGLGSRSEFESLLC